MSIIKNLFITGVGFFAGMAAAKNEHHQYESLHDISYCDCHKKEKLQAKVHSCMEKYANHCRKPARVEPFKMPNFSEKVIETEVGTLTMTSDTTEIVVKGVVNNAQRFSQIPIEFNKPNSWMNKASELIKQSLKENGIEPKSFRIEWKPDDKPKSDEQSKPDPTATCNNELPAIPTRSEEVCEHPSPSRDEERVDLRKDTEVDGEETEPVAKDEAKFEPVVDKREHSRITVSDKTVD